MSNEDDLKSIFENDPFNILGNEKTKTSSVRSEEQRLIESFEEISSFFEEHQREPGTKGISEFKLCARLKGIRETSAKVKVLIPYDFYGLLSSCQEKSVSVIDIINDDPLGILNDDDLDQSVFKLSNVQKSDRIRPDYLARRTKCNNFNEYEDMFNSLHDDLKNRNRKLLQFKNEEITSGNFYVLNGVIVYLESFETKKKEFDFESGARIRFDGRTRCVFDNGTESSMLFRSLVKALDLDGFSISDVIPKECEDTVIDGSDQENGYIYVLTSQSPLHEVASIQNLHKIGYSTGDVTNRIKNARSEPTYLMADVELVSVFRCFNMCTNKLETTIHSFFNEVRLDIEISDLNGKKYHPREWFKAPLLVIEEAIDLIVTDEINNYYFDTVTEEIIMKNEKYKGE